MAPRKSTHSKTRQSKTAQRNSRTPKSGKHTDWLEKAHVLTEALPFMQLYDKKTVVINMADMP